jgi:hypothetical protein
MNEMMSGARPKRQPATARIPPVLIDLLATQQR